MRLDELTETMGDQIEIEWKSFLLRPEAKTEDYDSFVEYTKTWLRPDEAEPSIDYTVWASGEPQPNSSIPAQVAQKAVVEMAPEFAYAYHHRLMKAYFTENQNISDNETLLKLAAEVGIDRDALEAHAAENQQALTQMVIDEHNHAIQTSVTSIPAVVFQGSFVVPGAQPVAMYEKVVERIAAKIAELNAEA